MASNVIAWGWQIPASPPTKLALICLADSADAYGRCCFSMQWLAKQCDLSIEEANACLNELLSSQIITKLPATKPSRQFETWIEVLLNVQKPIENFKALMADRRFTHA